MSPLFLSLSPALQTLALSTPPCLRYKTKKGAQPILPDPILLEHYRMPFSFQYVQQTYLYTIDTLPPSASHTSQSLHPKKKSKVQTQKENEPAKTTSRTLSSHLWHIRLPALFPSHPFSVLSHSCTSSPRVEGSHKGTERRTPIGNWFQILPSLTLSSHI